MAAVLTKARTLYATATTFANYLEHLALLFARLLVARVFWQSGLQKVQTVDVLGLRVPTPVMENSTFFLFGNVFFPGKPEWFTDTAAVLSAIGELTLPLLLVLGFATRIGALGLLIMTLVIQLFVIQDAWWATHAWWMAVLFILLARGPGALSLDQLFGLERKKQ